MPHALLPPSGPSNEPKSSTVPSAFTRTACCAKEGVNELPTICPLALTPHGMSRNEPGIIVTTTGGRPGPARQPCKPVEEVAQPTASPLAAIARPFAKVPPDIC